MNQNKRPLSHTHTGSAQRSKWHLSSVVVFHSKYLKAFEDRGQEGGASDLVDPRWVPADDVPQQGEGAQATGRSRQAFVELIKQVLRSGKER